MVNPMVADGRGGDRSRYVRVPVVGVAGMCVPQPRHGWLDSA